MYIADYCNHRIVEWKNNAKKGRIIGGGRGQGNQENQLNYPQGVVLDKESDSLIISDCKNKRIIQWPRQNNHNGQIIISNISCHGIAIDKGGYLYISDDEKHEVKRYNLITKNEIVVAGGNGAGNHLNQLNYPTFIFANETYS